MRTFVLRARSAPVSPGLIGSAVGQGAHIEIIAHSVINAFFVSMAFRQDVEVCIVLESSEDFPRTIRLSGAEGLSLAGFHEKAVLDLLEQALTVGVGLSKDEMREVAHGVQIRAQGFEKLMAGFLQDRPVWLLDRKGEDVRSVSLPADPVFVLGDHLPMPKNILASLKRRGARPLSLGRKMLFASQCVILLNHELDRAGF